MSFRRRSVLALALLSLLPLGCQKPPYLETVQRTPYIGMPAGLNELQSVSVERIREKDIFKEFMGYLNRDARFQREIEGLAEKFGYHPINDIDLFLVGQRGHSGNVVGPNMNTVIIAKGRFDNPGPRLEVLRRWLAESVLIDPPEFRQGTRGAGYPTYNLSAPLLIEPNVTMNLSFAFPSSDLMVCGLSSGIFNETLDVISGEVEGITTDEAWREMLTRPDLGASLWGAGSLSARDRQQLAQTLPGDVPVKGVEQTFFDFEFGTRFDLTLGLMCGSSGDAQALQRQAKDGLKMFAPMLAAMGEAVPQLASLPGKIVVVLDGQTVRFELVLPPKDNTELNLELMRLVREASEGGLSMDELNPQSLLTPGMPGAGMPGAEMPEGAAPEAGEAEADGGMEDMPPPPPGGM